MLSERTLLTFLCAIIAMAITTGLMLADKATWPNALIVGLGAGGGTLIGVSSLIDKSKRP
ncbi:hypothetical protein [Nonomuraea sp. NPDC049684]|uniref:hypothetical protein n=1 Tax=unclassified Nonomuraea TaxID=2593643 RepID=UPI00378D18FB